MKEASSDVIEVRVVSGQNSLEVLQNQKTLSFSEQSWVDLQGGTLIHSTAYDEFILYYPGFYSNYICLVGVFVFSPTSTNVTVMFPSGAGVEARLREGTVTTCVLLPEEFKDSTLGLLGKMNGDARDDLTLSNGQLVQNNSNPEELFGFGAGCKKSTQIFVILY